MTKRKKEREEIIALLCSTNKEDRLLGLAIKATLGIRLSHKDWRTIHDKLIKHLGSLRISMKCNWSKTIRINSR